MIKPPPKRGKEIEMKNGLQKVKCGLAYLGLSILLVSMGLGCASTHKTTQTETTVTYPNGTSAKGAEQNKNGVEKTETTVTTTETKAEHPGMLSSTIHAIGYVIALPLILIGGLFRIIFGG